LPGQRRTQPGGGPTGLGPQLRGAPVMGEGPGERARVADLRRR
ncbi:DeoR family transcriptional regulator, partial [Streptomyces halstedii]|nr:DeoR family transcriptional regulator [Streptomyces halstedii]